MFHSWHYLAAMGLWARALSKQRTFWLPPPLLSIPLQSISPLFTSALSSRVRRKVTRPSFRLGGWLVRGGRGGVKVLCSRISNCEMKLVKPAALFQEVLKRGTNQARLLGLDVGSKYVGLAVSDENHKIATPISVLERTKKNINVMAEDFQTLVTKLSLTGFVVGYPFNIHGQSNVDAVQVKLFIEELRKTSVLDGVSYTYWDENYTTRLVETLLEPLDINPVDAKTMMDKFAAVGILQGYLDSMNRGLGSQDLNSYE